MLAACRLAGLSALEGHYVGVRARVQCYRREWTIALLPSRSRSAHQASPRTRRATAGPRSSNIPQPRPRRAPQSAVFKALAAF